MFGANVGSMLGGSSALAMPGLGAGLVGLSATSGLANTYLQWRNMEYMKDLQSNIFKRDDTSIQRRVADLKSAGLSPVLAAGQGASSGSPIQVGTPQVPDLSEKILGAMSLLKMQSDISTSVEQRRLMQSQQRNADISTAIKQWDLRQYIKSGTASNASGLAKTIRDLFGMSGSPMFEGIKNDIKSKVDPSGVKGKAYENIQKSDDWGNYFLTPSPYFTLPNKKSKEVKK